MAPETEARVFALGADGMPTGHLVRRSDRLVIVPDSRPREMVNPASRRLHTLGIYVFRIRGTSYHAAAVKAGNFRPGAALRLVREPANEFDPNAVAVFAGTARRPSGYANRQTAARLARLLDSGAELQAISLRGNGPGTDSVSPVVLVASPAMVAHLSRRL